MIEDFMMEFDEGPSFAKAMESFGKAIVIETKIYHVVQGVKIPKKEVRKMLRCFDLQTSRLLPIHEYLIKVIEKMGLGKYQLLSINPFEITYKALVCEICELYPEARFGHVCHAAVDGLQLLFNKVLSLPSDVEEIECTVAKDPACVFQIRIQPLSGYKVALEKEDLRLLLHLADNHVESAEELASALFLPVEDVKKRLDILIGFRLLTENLSLSNIGKNYVKFGEKLMEDEKEEDFPPPWEEEEKKEKEKASQNDIFAKAFELPFKK